MAPWRRYLLLLTWLLAPIAEIYLLSLRQPIFTDRYLIWIAPAAMMFLALGIQTVYRHALTLRTAIMWGLVAYVLAFWLYVGWQQKILPMKYDLRAGMTYVARQRTPGALLILQIPHLEYAYRYYTSDFGPRPFAGSEPRLAPWASGLWTNNGFPDAKAQQEAAQQMERMTAGFTDVWVIRSEVEMWDARHLMDRWLDAHAELVKQADFTGVQVRDYRLKR